MEDLGACAAPSDTLQARLCHLPEQDSPEPGLCDLQGLEEQPTHPQAGSAVLIPSSNPDTNVLFSLFWLGCSCKVVLLKELRGENVAYVEFSFSEVLKCCVFCLYNPGADHILHQ